MRSVYVSLPTVRVVQSFVAQISKLEGDFDLIDGKYILDAKSIMGILSLNLSKPLNLIIEKDTEETMQIIENFICETEVVSVETAQVMSVV